MARLLFHVELHGGLADQDYVGGECIVVERDGHVFSELERRQAGVIDTDLSVEDAQAKYLKDGVPDDMKDAAAAERKRFIDAMIAAGDDQRARDAVPRPDRAIVDAADPRRWPARAFVVDLARLDPLALRLVSDNWNALRECAEQAKASAKIMVLEKWAEQKGRALTIDEAATETKDIVAGLAQEALRALRVRDAEGVKLADERQTEILAASRDGRFFVEREALASVSVPRPHALDARALDAATVRRA